MFENPFAKNLRRYPRRKEIRLLLDNNTIQVDDSKNIFFNKISLDKRMDDYEYEKKYLKFVKEMKLKIGNFVEFEPELRKKKRVIKENNFMNKTGLNSVLPRKTIKNTTCNTNNSTDNNYNLNFNKFLSLQNDFFLSQNSLNIPNPIFPTLFMNKNQMNFQRENLSKHDEVQTISKDRDKIETNRGNKETDENEKIKFQHKKENAIKNYCNIKSFRELILKSKLTMDRNNSNDNINISRVSNGMTARKFFNNKYCNLNKTRKSSDFFLTNNNNSNQFNQDNFSRTQCNFKIENDDQKTNQLLSSTQNPNFFKFHQKDDDKSKQAKIRPESNRTHYELDVKKNNIKNNFGLNNKDNLNKKLFFSKKNNLKIKIDKDDHTIHNHNLSKKNISTQSINLKNFSSKNTNNNFIDCENTIMKGNKLSTNFKSKETNSDLDANKNMLIKNEQIINDIQNKESLFSNKLQIHMVSPKDKEKTAENKLMKTKEFSSIRKSNNESNLESSKLNTSIYATCQPKRNFSAKALYNKFSDRKGQFYRELRSISFHNTSINRDASGKWYNPTKKIKRKFLMREINDERIEDKQDLVLPKHDKREKDFIKSPDDNYADKKIYFIEKNKANMINHINTISRMTDENYMKYGYFLENKYDFYAQQVDIPEYIFASSRYRPKTNTREIDRRTSDIKIVFENILKVKSRILKVKFREDGKPALKN